MKKKILMSSVLSIVLCLTLICGATFALFTDTDQVNIAVTSGKVDIEVTVENIQTISREQDKWDDDKLFTNGGKVEFAEDSNKLTIDRITPGDAVKFDLVVTNKSNVDIKFFTKLGLVEGIELFQGMKYTINTKNVETKEITDSESFSGLTRASEWVQLDGLTGDKTEAEVARIEVIIELPYLSEAQNDLQDKSTKLYYTVQAVQANADAADMELVKTGVTCLYTPVDLQLFAANVNNGNNYAGETVTLMNDIDLAGIDWTPIGYGRAVPSVRPFKGTFDGADYVISNLAIDAKGLDEVGFFGLMEGTMQNVTFKNATVKSDSTNGTGVAVGSTGYGGLLTAVKVVDSTVTAPSKVGGVIGFSCGDVIGCSVENVTVTATPILVGAARAISYDYGNHAGGVVGYAQAKGNASTAFRNAIEKCTATNVTLYAYRDVGGVVGTLSGAADKTATVSGCAANGVTITIDQETFFYEDKAPNAGAIVGRGATAANVTDSTETGTIDISRVITTADSLVKAADDGVTAVIPEGVEIKLTLAAGEGITNPVAGKPAVVNYGKLTVNGGEITNDYYLAQRSAAIVNYGDLVLNDVTVGSDNNRGAAVQNEGGTITINGGFFATITRANPYDGYAYVFINNSGTMNIYDAEVNGYPNGVFYANAGVINVYGGSYVIKDGGNTWYTAYAADGATINLYNGYFQWYKLYCNAPFTGDVNLYGGTYALRGAAYDLSANASAFLAEGKKVIKNGNLYIVVPENENATIVKPSTSGNPIAEAIAGGNTSIYLTAGNYTLPAGLNDKTVTITGDKSVVIDCTTSHNTGSSTFTFVGVTIQGINADYRGFQHSDVLVFENCVIDSQTFLYANEITFNNCTFNQTSPNAYNVWTYGAGVATFNGCTFNSAGKSVLLYKESDNTVRTVNFNDCVFNASQPVAGKAAIEIDTSISPNYIVNINNCTANGFAEGSVSGNTLWNQKKGTTAKITVDGVEIIYTAEAFAAALQAGRSVSLAANIALDAPVNMKGGVLDGNGYTITMSDACTNTWALIFLEDAADTVIKNVVFDGIKGGAAIRTKGTNLVLDNCTFRNCVNTQVQGIVRLNYGDATVTNCKFVNNTCTMALTFNYDPESSENVQNKLHVEGCLFENNTASVTAVLYYVKGGGCTLKDNSFIGNTLNCSNNGATVYMGFTEGNVITGNLFKNNTATDSSTSVRVAGGIFFGYETVFTGNAFINNSASNSDGTATGNDVCVSVYYTDIDISGNYWGGSAPVEGVNYHIQHKSPDTQVISNDYLTTYGE